VNGKKQIAIILKQRKWRKKGRGGKRQQKKKIYFGLLDQSVRLFCHISFMATKTRQQIGIDKKTIIKIQKKVS
jgi:hypothetical protein